MTEVIKNYIDGRWTDACSGATFESRNPARTDEITGIAPQSGPEDCDAAVAAARSAFRRWSLTPAPRRGEILFRAAELLLTRKEALGRLVTREMGKILSEGLGDVQEAIDMAYFMAGEGRRLSGETVPSELPAKDARSLRIPVGVCVLITPWNFPVAIPAWKVLPALICGNTVILKPSEVTPACATKFVETLIEAGLPKGVLNLIHGGGAVGEYLVKHRDVDAVSFTGSCEVGEYLEELCGGLHKRFCAEMGGKNALIIMEDADLPLAVDGALWGGFGTSGQRCTAASRIIVHEAVHERFVSLFVERAKRLKVGNGLLSTTDVGPVVNEDQYKKVLDYIRIGQEEGARLLLGGKPLQEGDCARGYFIEPTIFVDVLPKMRIAQEEIFGPVVCVLKARNLEEAIQIANDTPFGLSASLYTRNVNSTAVAERDLDMGIIYINAPTIGAEIQLPFGGTKRSGRGLREAGGRGGALDMFSKWKVIYRDYSGRLQRAQIDRE